MPPVIERCAHVELGRLQDAHVLPKVSFLPLEEDRIDLAIRLGPVNQPDAVVRRVARTPLVCVGSRRYFRQRGKPRIPAELADHNCLLYGGLMESADWPFVGLEGRFSVTVSGNLSSNSVETIRAGVLAGLGIGMFAKVSLAEELRDPDVMRILEEFIDGVRDISLIWPKRRFVPARVRRTTDFFAAPIPQRIYRQGNQSTRQPVAAPGDNSELHRSWVRLDPTSAAAPSQHRGCVPRRPAPRVHTARTEVHIAPPHPG